MSDDFDTLIDKLFKFVKPNALDTPAFRNRQKEILTDLQRAFGVSKFQKIVDTWIKDNMDSGSTFDAIAKQKPYKTEYNLPVRKPSLAVTNIAPNIHKDKDCYLWESIYKDFDQNDRSYNHIISDTYLVDMLITQFPEYNKAPEKFILAYLSANFKTPLVLGVKDFSHGLSVLINLYRKLNRLTEHLVVSPSVIDTDLSPYGYWEDFPSWGIEPVQKEILRGETYNIGQSKVGFFSLCPSDDPSKYHSEFVRLLKHYIYNYKNLILIHKRWLVPSNSWLYQYLDKSITIDLEG